MCIKTVNTVLYVREYVVRQYAEEKDNFVYSIVQQWERGWEGGKS
jgi:hypothetical protein